MKRCSHCKKEKEYSEFHKDRSKKYGYSDRCKECNRIMCGEYQRKRKYGISLDEYASLIRIQNNKCLICFKDMVGKNSRYVDHDHITGRIRGLLCLSCNTAIGLLKDSPISAIRVAKYLLENNSRGIDYNSLLWGEMVRRETNTLLEVVAP